MKKTLCFRLALAACGGRPSDAAEDGTTLSFMGVGLPLWVISRESMLSLS